MKEEDPVERSRDWFRQAEKDLEHARKATALGDFEWVCFAAQQAAEKAVKSLHEVHGGHGWGHSILKLLEDLEEVMAIADRLKDAARVLDRMYIPTRYPNGFDQGIPGDYFTAEDASRAIEEGHVILEFVRPQVP